MKTETKGLAEKLLKILPEDIYNYLPKANFESVIIGITDLAYVEGFKDGIKFIKDQVEKEAK